MSGRPPFTLIVPAHNEENVIARCLECVLADAPDDHAMQIIVAANGCTDRTVEIAKRTAPDAIVLDIAQGGKAAAMNLANAQALHFPRIYLDADIQCGYASLEAVAQELNKPGVMAASPKIAMDLSRSDFFVRAYYRVWLTQPYVQDAMVGSGCFGLSKAAYERIGNFPEITGDDIWVYSRFPQSERRNVSRNDAGEPVSFLVSPPRKAADQVRVETRRRLGNKELLAQHPSPHYEGSNRPGDLRDALKNGASILDVGIYLVMKFLARSRAERAGRNSEKIVWERDLAAREV
ncbi:MAG: glycosyltransferase [Pseudomonadota bacterium]|nr:glycosyltransferase [Pseudomonadota bacterium]